MARNWGRILRTSGFLALLGTCGFQVARTATAEPVTRPVEVDRGKAQREAVSRVGGADVKSPLPAGDTLLVGGNGVVEPRDRETRVAAQVTAVVRKIRVKEGDHVRAGDPLVQLEDGVERAALQAAEADAAAERAALAKAEAGLRAEDREALSAEVTAARARADLAADTLRRTEALATSGAVPAAELEKARRQASAEEASLRSTEARLRAATAGTRGEDVEAARARLASAEARVAQAKAALGRLVVRAPAEGDILQLKVREGELYSFQGSEPLLLMGDLRRLRVRMDVDERDVARVRTGQAAWVVADAHGERRFPGTVVELGRRFGRKNVRTDDPVEKNDTKVLEVLIELEENDVLLPGQRVTCFISAANALAAR